MKKFTYFFLFATLGLTACKKEVDYKLVAEKPQLVVQSFFTPAEDSIKVYLSYTESFFEDKSIRNSLVANISKAQLTMSDGAITKPLKWSVRKAAFVLATKDLPLIANKTYSISVKTLDGNTAAASSKMPNEITGAQLIRVKGTSVKNQVRKDRLILELNAESGKTNYLEFRLFVKSTYTSFGNVSEQLRLINKSIIKEDALTAAIGVTYSDDVPVNTGSSSGPPNPNFSFVIVYQGLFIKANEEYYKYLDASKKNFDASGNPFAEPTSLYTNITGGLGVFAAYQLVIKEIPYD
jgi:hypothetical protein